MNNNDKNFQEQNLSQLMDGEWHGLDRSECVASLCADETLRGKWARYHMIRDAMNNEPVKADLALVSRICSAIEQEPAYTNITPFSAAGADAHSDDISVADRHVAEPASEYGNSVVAEPGKAQVATLPARAPLSDAANARVGKPSWVTTGVAGFALAASVALVTVVGVNVLDQGSPASGVSVVASHSASGTNTALTSGDAALPLSQTASVDSAIALPQADLVQGDSAVLPVVDFVSNTNPGTFWVSPDSQTRVSDEERLNMMLSQHIENSPTATREGLLPYSRLVGYQTVEQEER